MSARNDNPSIVAAMRTGNIALLRDLIRRGCDCNAKGLHGITALHLAAANSTATIVMALLRGGSRVNSRDGDGATPLFCAVNNRQSRAIITALVNHGASVNARDKFGCTPLMRAAAKGELMAVRALVGFGAKVNEVSKNDETALSFAVVWNHAKIVRFLFSAGAKVKLRSGNKWGTLEYAEFEGNQEIIDIVKREYRRLQAR